MTADGLTARPSRGWPRSGARLDECGIAEPVSESERSSPRCSTCRILVVDERPCRGRRRGARARRIAVERRARGAVRLRRRARELPPPDAGGGRARAHPARGDGTPSTSCWTWAGAGRCGGRRRNGSGCIALALATEVASPRLRDRHSLDALAVARRTWRRPAARCERRSISCTVRCSARYSTSAAEWWCRILPTLR